MGRIRSCAKSCLELNNFLLYGILISSSSAAHILEHFVSRRMVLQSSHEASMLQMYQVACVEAVCSCVLVLSWGASGTPAEAPTHTHTHTQTEAGIGTVCVCVCVCVCRYGTQWYWLGKGTCPVSTVCSNTAILYIWDQGCIVCKMYSV